MQHFKNIERFSLIYLYSVLPSHLLSSFIVPIHAFAWFLSSLIFYADCCLILSNRSLRNEFSRITKTEIRSYYRCRSQVSIILCFSKHKNQTKISDILSEPFGYHKNNQRKLRTTGMNSGAPSAVFLHLSIGVMYVHNQGYRRTVIFLQVILLRHSKRAFKTWKTKTTSYTCVSLFSSRVDISFSINFSIAVTFVKRIASIYINLYSCLNKDSMRIIRCHFDIRTIFL